MTGLRLGQVPTITAQHNRQGRCQDIEIIQLLIFFKGNQMYKVDTINEKG